MVKKNKLKSAFLKTIIGILIYLATIDIVIYLQFGIPSTPLNWIYVPIYNLTTFNWGAWLILLLSLAIGWSQFETE